MGEKRRKSLLRKSFGAESSMTINNDCTTTGECLPSLLILFQKGGDAFINNIIRGLSPYFNIEKAIPADQISCQTLIKKHQNVWIEWGNEFAKHLTNSCAPELRGRRVFLRIHGYEIMTGLADQIDYRQINDLIFVCRDMRDILLNRKPEIRKQVERIHVIPNGVDTDKFKLIRRNKGHHIASIGYINYKKGPVLLLHAFEEIHRQDPRFQLHVAGRFQDFYHEVYWQHFLQQNGLRGFIHYNGWIENLPSWLSSKHFVISTSLSESQGMGVLEAMATGCQPLIYNFHTASSIYPAEYLWNTQEDLINKLYMRQEPSNVRDFVVNNYSISTQIIRLREMLEERIEVVFEGPTSYKEAQHQVPTACFSENLTLRQEANKEYGFALLENGNFLGATVFLERALAQSDYKDEASAGKLLETYIEQGRYDRIASVFRDMGLAAASRGDYNTMLLRFYDAYYYTYSITRSYRWLVFDKAIDTTLRLVAPHIEPLAAHHEIIQKIDHDKIKIVIGCEGFDPQWSSIKRLIDLGVRLDKSKFQVIYFSRLAPSIENNAVIEMLINNGCFIAYSSDDEVLPHIRKGLYLLKNIKADVFLLTTSWLTPHLDLLAHCRGARYNVVLATQGGGLETSADYIISTVEALFLDDNKEGVHVGPMYEFTPPHRKQTLKRKGNILKAAVIGRSVKLKNHSYWNTLAEVMRGIPELEIDIMGATSKEIFGSENSPFPRLRCLGFRRDISELLPQYDLYIDTWPLGGGSTLREAHWAGLPIISYKANWFEHYNAAAKIHVALIEFVHPDLLLDTCDCSLMLPVISKLSRDHNYYLKICQESAAIPVLSPDESANKIVQFLFNLTHGKQGD